MKLVSKFLLHYFVGCPHGRLEVRREITNLILEDGLLPKRIHELTKSKVKFWLLAPFAWDSRNARRPWCVFFTGMIMFVLLATVLLIAQGFVHFMIFNNWLSLLTSILSSFLMLLFVPILLIFSIETVMNSKTDDGHAWSRCWLVLTSYVKGGNLQSIEEIDRELTSLLEPVSPTEYIRIKERSKTLGGVSLVLVLLHIMSWLALFSFDSPISKDWRGNGVLGPIYVGTLMLAMAPGMFGMMQENVKKPVRVLEKDLHLLSERSKGDFYIDSVLKNYNSEAVNKKMKMKAKRFYYLGALCAWDLEKADIVVATCVLLSSYLLINTILQGNSLNINVFVVRSFTVLTAILFIGALAEAWFSGGGATKAMQRLNIIRLLKEGRPFSDIITLNSLLECFSTGSYNKPAKSATIEDFVTKLYMKSISKTTKRRSR